MDIPTLPNELWLRVVAHGGLGDRDVCALRASCSSVCILLDGSLGLKALLHFKKSVHSESLHATGLASRRMRLTVKGDDRGKLKRDLGAALAQCPAPWPVSGLDVKGSCKGVKGLLRQLFERCSATLVSLDSDNADLSVLMPLLSTLAKLESLYFDCPFDTVGTSDAFRLKLPSLRSLWVCQWSDADRVDARQLTSLRSMTLLGSNGFLETLVGPVPSLTTLSWSCLGASSQLFRRAVGLFPSLQSLSLTYGDLGSSLRTLTALRSLFLRQCDVPVEVLESLELHLLPQLTTLSLDTNPAVGDDVPGLVRFLGTLPRLTHLCLDDCEIPGLDIDAVIASLPRLEELSVSDQDYGERDVLAFLRAAPPSLRALYVFDGVHAKLTRRFGAVDARLRVGQEFVWESFST